MREGESGKTKLRRLELPSRREKERKKKTKIKETDDFFLIFSFFYLNLLTSPFASFILSCNFIIIRYLHSSSSNF